MTTNETFHITPEHIGSKLLLKLKKMAEADLGMAISKAVISVPAEFDERQRNSTVKAANLAGDVSISEFFLETLRSVSLTLRLCGGYRNSESVTEMFRKDFV